MLLGQLLLVQRAQCQEIIITGQVLDSLTSKPIAYVNIGIEGKNVGTVSREDGRFSLMVPEKFITDSLTFSAVTHKKVKRFILDLSKAGEIKILLTQNTIELDLVTVQPKGKPKVQTLGIRKRKREGCFTRKFNRGAQVAQLIEAQKYPVELNRVRLSLMHISESMKMRVRIFDQDKKTLQPGKELLFENVIYEVHAGERGWIEIDISEQSIWLEEDFYVSVEFIEGGFFFASCLDATAYRNQQWIRLTSMGVWERAADKLLNNLNVSRVIVLGAEVLIYK